MTEQTTNRTNYNYGWDKFVVPVLMQSQYISF